MTGLRPGIPGINGTDSRDKDVIKEVVEGVVTLPENLRNHGVFTMNVGKSFHTYDTTADAAWDVQMRPGGGSYQLPENLQRERDLREALKRNGPSARWKVGRGHATESAEAPDENYQTFRIADRAIGMLRDHAEQRADRPFFLSVGFYKPHLPFVAPQRYWDLYDRGEFEVPPRTEPDGIAKFELPESWYEVRAYGDIPRRGDLDDAKTLEMIHGYHACVSFVDAQVERLLDELDAQGLRENTVVIVWGDHGFKLGDYGDWSKYTNMEIDARVPLFVAGPGVAAGERTDALVELIDLYPTIADLMGFGVPPHVEATSFVPVLEDPDTEWKAGALSYYDRRNPDGEGFSIRGPRYRYTEWRDYEAGEVLDRELYDHAEDPIAETNLADDPARAADVERLSGLLADGWASLVPAAAPKLPAAPSTKPDRSAEPVGGTGGEDDEEVDGASADGGSFPAGPGGVLVYDGFTREGENGGAFLADHEQASVTVGGVRLEVATEGENVFRATGGGTGVGPDPAAGDFDLTDGDAFTLTFDAGGTIENLVLRAISAGNGKGGTGGAIRLTNRASGVVRELPFASPAKSFEDLDLEPTLAFEAGDTIRLEVTGGAKSRVLSLRVQPDAAD